LVRIILRGFGELVRPSVDDWVSVDVIDAGHDALFELLFRGHADMAQDGASKFGEESLDEIEPGAMRRREGELETTGPLGCEPCLSFLGDVRGMIIEDQLDGRVRRIGGIEEQLEEFDMTRAWTFPVSRSMPAKRLTVPCRLYSWSRAKLA
jgi:hypothetical protein